MVIAILMTFICVILLALALIFSVVPGVPGPPFAYICLIIISIAGGWEIYGIFTLVILCFITFFTLVLDYFIPFLTAKKAGAGKAGIWGSITGMVLGLVFFPPFGSIIGAFAGALAGEMLLNRENKAPFRSSFAIITGTFLVIIIKVSVIGIMGFFIMTGLIKLY